MQLFPEVRFDRRQFESTSVFRSAIRKNQPLLGNETVRHLCESFFKDVAKIKIFDYLIADNWYKLRKEDIMNIEVRVNFQAKS